MAMNREDGLMMLEARAVILAMGCREAKRRFEYSRIPPGRHLHCGNSPASGKYGGIHAGQGSGDPGFR